MHVKCSGLATASQHHLSFSCRDCQQKPSATSTTKSASPSLPTTNNSPAPPDNPQPSDFWNHTSPENLDRLRTIYNEVVHWKSVFFTISKNKAGFKFTDTLNIILSGTENHLRAETAMICAFIMPHLILPRSKGGHDGSITKTLSRRLDQLLVGDFEGLFREAKPLQERLPKSNSYSDRDEFKEFDKYMCSGKISNAIRCLTDETKGGVLSVNQKITVKGKTKSVLEILQEKHPKSKPLNPDLIVPDNPPNSLPFHPAIFDRLNAAALRRAAMKTNGSHGPSGLDAQEWRRLLTSFKSSSNDLCKTLARLTLRVATEDLDFLDSYNACRLIALDKCPGVRPIGIGEVLRLIIGRSIMKCVKQDLMKLGGNIQLCLGQKCGIEHAIHSLRKAYSDPENEAILLIDAQNAFNSLNRNLALENIKKLCPSIYTALMNSYKKPSHLYINKITLKSQEGTTQGDPLAMAMYGIAILPLINHVSDPTIIQKWYADDGNAAGSISSLKALLDKLCTIGSDFGYHVIKCHLIVKDHLMDKAKQVFKDKDVEITSGHRVLGSAIGSEESCDSILQEKQVKYNNLLEKLSQHAKTSPQNVYKAFTNGVQHKLTFITRTTPNSNSILHATENVIKDKLIPSIVHHPSYDDKHRQIFSLPVREGGLNILTPDDREHEYERSIKITKPFEEAEDIETAQNRIISSIKREKESQLKTKKHEIRSVLTEAEAYSLNLAMEKGSSCWLNALPLKRYNFDLTKSEFRDGIALRYGWEPLKMPSICACGESFTVSHALHCPKGGYTHIRHNDIRDSFANLLNEVCDDVEIEPYLQPLQGESFTNKTTSTEDDARLDIKANGLWENRFSKTFFDVKIFNPHAKSCPKTIPDAYKHHEQAKKLKYEQRIIELEKATFNPLVFSCTGGAGPAASKVMKRIAGKLSDKKEDPYADIITYIRTKISFALLRSSVLCIRGSRSLRRRPTVEASIGTIVEEGRLLL